MLHSLILPILYQIININSTTPCLFNQTAGWEMIKNCGFGTDYLKAALLPWEWITGGWLSFIIVTLLILVTYIKYHKVLYPILIGFIFIPISYFVFPDKFLTFAIFLSFIGIGISIWFVFFKQTND